jgi:hypothetical protein
MKTLAGQCQHTRERRLLYHGQRWDILDLPKGDLQIGQHGTTPVLKVSGSQFWPVSISLVLASPSRKQMCRHAVFLVKNNKQYEIKTILLTFLFDSAQLSIDVGR